MRILILKNNITDQATIDAGLNLTGQECKSVGLNLEFVQVITEVHFSTERYNDPNLIDAYKVNTQQIFDEAKKTGIPFDGICFIYDYDKVAPQPPTPARDHFHPHEDGQVMQIPVQWFADHARVLADFFEHELCHLMFATSTKPDITHNQQITPGWGNKQANEWYLHVLAQFTDTGPVAIIKRYYQAKETTGVLTAQNGNSSFSCKSVELPWLNNVPNISCIPVGNYQVKWTRSLKFPLGSYEILNVPNRTGIRIHSGNFYHDLLGCIALGNSFADLDGDGLADVANSGVTIASFNAFFGKKPFTLKIT